MPQKYMFRMYFESKGICIFSEDYQTWTVYGASWISKAFGRYDNGFECPHQRFFLKCPKSNTIRSSLFSVIPRVGKKYWPEIGNCFLEELFRVWYQITILDNMKTICGMWNWPQNSFVLNLNWYSGKTWKSVLVIICVFTLVLAHTQYSI